MQLADRKQYGALHWGKKGAIVKLQDKDMNYDFNKEVHIYIYTCTSRRRQFGCYAPSIRTKSSYISSS